MASSITKTSFFLTVTLLVFISTISSTQAQTQECASKLIGCADDVNTTTKPSNTCCSAITDAVTNDLACLCNLYNTPGLLASLGVSVAQALNLTSRCGIPASLSACNATAGSPTSAPPPPVPGSDGFRMTWTGFWSLILLAAYVLFY